MNKLALPFQKHEEKIHHTARVKEEHLFDNNTSYYTQRSALHYFCN